MFNEKMKKISSSLKTAKAPSSPLVKVLLFLSVAIFMTALMTNPCMAKQNDVLLSDAMAAIAETISKDLPASYNINKVAESYTAENRAHGLKMEFSDQEIRFCKSDNAWSYAFTLTGIGYDSLKSPPPAEITARRNRIEFRRGRDLTEWYINMPLGIEQGFTLHNRPGNVKGPGCGLN